MRLLLLTCSIMVLWMLEIPGALSGDSASIELQDSVGYSRPSANRASAAEQANRARHADTADRILGEEPGVGEGGSTIKEICGPGTQRCAQRIGLLPGTYMVKCGSHPEDGNWYQVTVVITGESGSAYDWAGCPYGTIARLGISNRYLQLILRIG